MSYAVDSSVPSVTRAQRVAGMVLSGLLIAFLVFDGVIKLIPLPVVTEMMAGLGYSADPSLARLLGVITLGCAILYAIPRTSVLGAILLTGLLGGAMATHLRVGSPICSHLLFGVYVGVIAWGGLYLRYEAVRKMIPFFQRSF